MHNVTTREWLIFKEHTTEFSLPLGRDDAHCLIAARRVTTWRVRQDPGHSICCTHRQNRKMTLVIGLCWWCLFTQPCPSVALGPGSAAGSIRNPYRETGPPAESASQSLSRLAAAPVVRPPAPTTLFPPRPPTDTKATANQYFSSLSPCFWAPSRMHSQLISAELWPYCKPSHSLTPREWRSTRAATSTSPIMPKIRYRC